MARVLETELDDTRVDLYEIFNRGMEDLDAKFRGDLSSIVASSRERKRVGRFLEDFTREVEFFQRDFVRHASEKGVCLNVKERFVMADPYKGLNLRTIIPGTAVVMTVFLFLSPLRGFFDALPSIAIGGVLTFSSAAISFPLICLMQNAMVKHAIETEYEVLQVQLKRWAEGR